MPVPAQSCRLRAGVYPVAGMPVQQAVRRTGHRSGAKIRTQFAQVAARPKLCPDTAHFLVRVSPRFFKSRGFKAQRVPADGAIYPKFPKRKTKRGLYVD